MKTLEQIRKDLKQIQDAFRYGLKREQFGCVSYPKNFQTMAESYLTVSEQAPKRLKTVFDELYVKAKTQKVYAAERGVTENTSKSSTSGCCFFCKRLWQMNK